MAIPAFCKRARLARLLPLLLFGGVCALTLFVFWILLQPGDELGFSVLFFYLLLPLTILLTSFWIGTDAAFGHVRFATPLLYGALFWLVAWLTFDLANLVANGFSRPAEPDWIFLPAGAVLSLIGLGLGALVRALRAKAHRQKAHSPNTAS